MAQKDTEKGENSVGSNSSTPVNSKICSKAIDELPEEFPSVKLSAAYNATSYAPIKSAANVDTKLKERLSLTNEPIVNLEELKDALMMFPPQWDGLVDHQITPESSQDDDTSTHEGDATIIGTEQLKFQGYFLDDDGNDEIMEDGCALWLRPCCEALHALRNCEGCLRRVDSLQWCPVCGNAISTKFVPC